MIGSKQIAIDASDFLRGMSSGSEVADGGFSDETEAVNLIADPGVLYAPAAEVDSDTDTRLSTNGEIIASIPDHNAVGVDARLLVARDGTEDGTFYRYNGTKIIAAAYGGQDTAHDYAKGFTDAINFAGESYITNKQTIVRWTGTSTFDLAFATFTTSNVPHPALAYENNAYFGDKNLLLRMTAAGGAPATILTLDAGQIIIALGIDPGTGKMLISTVNSLNMSNTLNTVNKIHWYDGSSNKTSKVIQVEDQVLAFHPHGGRVFVGYGKHIGMLNGSGIDFVHSLPNVTNDQEELPYKHNWGSINRTMYVVDGAKVLAFGPILKQGSSIWYYAAANKFSSPNKFRAIFNAGADKLGLSAATEKFYTVSITSISNLDALDLYTNWISFDRPVYIRSIYFQLAASDNTSNYTLTYFDQSAAALINTLERQEGNITPVLESDYWINFADTANTAGNTGEGHQALRAFKLRFQTSTSNKGLKKIIIDYDYAE